MLALLRFFLRESPWLAGGAALVGIASGATSTALMALINRSLQSSAEIEPSTSALAFAVFLLGFAITNGVSRLLMGMLSHRTTYRLRVDLCRQVANSPLRTIEDLGESRILAALTEDIAQLTYAMTRFPTLSVNCVIVVGCLVYIGLLSPLLLLCFGLFLAFSVSSVKLAGRPAARRMRKAREAWDQLVGHFHGLTGGIKELQLHDRRRQDFFDRALEPAAEQQRRYRLQAAWIYAGVNSWSQALFFALIGLLMYGLGDRMGIGTDALTRFVVTGFFLRGHLIPLVEMIPNFQEAAVALEKVERLGVSLAAPAEDENDDEAKPGFESPGESPVCETIELVGVEHNYYREREERNFRLGPIDLRLRAGEILFLTGGNGSGKTTLAKLLTGLYRPEAGEIRVDGQPVDTSREGWYRQHFSAVFTDFHLFDGLYGFAERNVDLDRRANEYLAGLQLDHKVRIDDGSLSTTELSRGQRKRLALLTAYLENRPVYVLDEWASDQDPEFKRLFYTSILADLKARNKIVVVISHDDHYFHVADRIVKLAEGRLEAALQPV